MHIVYVHLGPKPVPAHTWESVRQIREIEWMSKTRLDAPIWIISPAQTWSMEDLKQAHATRTTHVPSEWLDDFDKNVEFKKVSFLDYTPVHWQGFWETTMQRTFYLEAFMRKVDEYSTVLHIENDVLLYQHPYDATAQFHGLFKDRLACMDGADGHSSLAFTYIDNVKGIEWLNNQWLWHLAQGQKHCVEYINDPHETCVNEMVLLRAIRKEYPNAMGTLPILPSGKGSNNFDVLHKVFDPMSWGQWVCGVHQNPGVPYSVAFHWIGEQIIAKKFGVEWGDSVPYVVEYATGIKTPLVNLHVHSKELSRWRHP